VQNTNVLMRAHHEWESHIHMFSKKWQPYRAYFVSKSILLKVLIFLMSGDLWVITVYTTYVSSVLHINMFSEVIFKFIFIYNVYT
jgi:hypothetical protein